MKRIIILIISGILPLMLTAQVQLMDLSVIPIVSNSTDSVELTIVFKVSPVSQVQSLYFAFGTQAGYNDILSDNASIIYNNGTYSINYNNETIPIEDYQAQLFCKLSQTQYSTWQQLSLFITDLSGNQSNVLVFNK